MSLEKLFDETGGPSDPADLYREIQFGSADGRPYTFINMVATADGKCLIGPRGSTAKGVGSPTDQMLMRRLEELAEGIIIGAGTLRTSHVIYPAKAFRAVVTRSGDLPLENRFFTDAPDKAIVFAPDTISAVTRGRIESAAQLRIAGKEEVDVSRAVQILKDEFGIRLLLSEGGPQLNFDFFSAGIVDEFFLTLAPKIKGGAQLPTPVDGPGLPEIQFVPMDLISLYRDESELFLRYRVKNAS